MISRRLGHVAGLWLVAQVSAGCATKSGSHAALHIDLRETAQMSVLTFGAGRLAGWHDGWYQHVRVGVAVPAGGRAVVLDPRDVYLQRPDSPDVPAAFAQVNERGSGRLKVSAGGHGVLDLYFAVEGQVPPASLFVRGRLHAGHETAWAAALARLHEPLGRPQHVAYVALPAQPEDQQMTLAPSWALPTWRWHWWRDGQFAAVETAVTTPPLPPDDVIAAPYAYAPWTYEYVYAGEVYVVYAGDEPFSGDEAAPRSAPVGDGWRNPRQGRWRVLHRAPPSRADGSGYSGGATTSSRDTSTSDSGSSSSGPESRRSTASSVGQAWRRAGGN